MISLNFGLWWSGTKLSYLRYLTFKSLRHFHPEAKIQLFVGDKCNNKVHNWNREKQDFEREGVEGKDYLDELGALNVEVIHGDFFSQYASNYQSDFFRWWWLKNNGGFYLDTDQIILRPFDTLPLKSNLIYSVYQNPQCGPYAPVGVIGADKDCKAVTYMMDNIVKNFNPNNYNSVGPFLFLKAIRSVDMTGSFNAPPNYFYPALHSDLVPLIYNGSLKIPKESYSLHLFLGHPISQEFNGIYTEEFARTNDDTVSKYLRDNKLI